MTLYPLLMLLGVVFSTAGGHLLLRSAATRWITGDGLWVFLVSVLRSPAPAAGILVLGAPVLYWKALETVPLSSAYAVMALTGILVQVGGRLLLKERPSRRVLIGAVLCCAGIAVWGL